MTRAIAVRHDGAGHRPAMSIEKYGGRKRRNCGNKDLAIDDDGDQTAPRPAARSLASINSPPLGP